MNTLIQYGAYFPIFLPLIAYFIGFPKLALLIIADLLILNPLFKTIIGILGLQSKRPECPVFDNYNYFCYGMPSGHTESHWIFLTYLLLIIYQSARIGETIPPKIIITTIIITVMTIIVMIQRYQSKRHSIPQIIGGAIAGIIIGIMFFWRK